MGYPNFFHRQLSSFYPILTFKTCFSVRELKKNEMRKIGNKLLTFYVALWGSVPNFTERASIFFGFYERKFQLIDKCPRPAIIICY
jgi:hypothetical protein